MIHSLLTGDALTAFLSAVLGSVITAGAFLYQSRMELRRTKRSIATALLWEIDDFYRANVQTTFRALERAHPSELGYYVRTPYKGFTVYDATADKVGLFRPETVKGLVLLYTSARAYLNVVDDYGRAVEQVDAGRPELKGRAVVLLDMLKRSTAQIIPLMKLVTELLAKEAGTTYKFEPAERTTNPVPTARG
jgi:hypothetical protein